MITKDYVIEQTANSKAQVIFPLIPQTCDIERLKQGGEHWQWDPKIPFYIGVLPRRGAKGSDVKVSQSLDLIPRASSTQKSQSDYVLSGSARQIRSQDILPTPTRQPMERSYSTSP